MPVNRGLSQLYPWLVLPCPMPSSYHTSLLPQGEGQGSFRWDLRPQGETSCEKAGLH